MNNSNDSAIEMIAQVLDEMKSVMGTDFSFTTNFKGAVEFTSALEFTFSS